jgi:hypothetical protein
MLKLSLWGITIAVMLLLFSSCQPVYVPNVVNMPLLKETGEIQLAAHTAIGGTDIQAAAAVHEKFAIMLNGNFQNRKFNLGEGFRRQQFGEFGIGYRQEIGENGRFEFFTGAGVGTIHAEYPVDFYWKPVLDVYSARIFVQPTIGFISDVIDFGFAPRLAYVSLLESGDRFDGLFIEPAFMLKGGYKYVKFMLQAGLSIASNRSSLIYDYNPFLLSFGIQFSINPLQLNKKDKAPYKN